MNLTIIIFAIAFIFCYFRFIPFRLAVMHPINTVYYAFKDGYSRLKHKERNNCPTGQLIAYTGLFGRGKTLSAVHYITSMYYRYNGLTVWDRDRGKFVTQKIHVLSNVDLAIPYEKFVSLQQVIRVSDKFREFDYANDTLTVTLVLGDEFSVQMNSRAFKSNIDPLFLNTLLTCRHHHISLIYDAQRFNHVDALLRQVTSYVVECRKLWRFMVQYQYDAFELENAANVNLVMPVVSFGWFVTDDDYNAYDTLACVGNLKKSSAGGDMMTEDEILSLQCNQPANMDAVLQPSKKYSKARKKMK